MRPKYDMIKPTEMNGGAKVEFAQKENDCPDYHYSNYDTVLCCVFRIFDFSTRWFLEISFGRYPACFFGNYDLCLHRKNK